LGLAGAFGLMVCASTLRSIRRQRRAFRDNGGHARERRHDSSRQDVLACIAHVEQVIDSRLNDRSVVD
jgi:hypothetical protein